MADTNMQKELSNLLGKKTLDPLEQTVFETGPKGGFTPPESINLYKETPTQFAQQPIGIEGADIDWYALGESGFKIANETFGAVIDHLITSKGNAVVDLSDEFQAKISAEYDKLQSIQAGVKVTGPTEESTTSIEQTITNIREHRTEWKKQANLALENGQGSLFQPAIDYWDETKSPIKSLGSAYQRLAVLSRKADRDIETTVRKTEWDAISTYVGKQTEIEDRMGVKNGVRKQTNKDIIFDRISSGKLPLFFDEGGPEYLNENGTKFGFDIVEGKQQPRPDSNGIPLVIMDKEGRTYLNPESNLDSLTKEEMDILWSRIQGNPYYEDNFSVTVTGEIGQDWKKKIKFSLSNSSAQSPQQLWLNGKVLSQIPTAHLAHAISELELSKADHSLALLLREAVNEGMPFEQISKLQAMTDTSRLQVLEYVTELEMPNIGGVRKAKQAPMSLANDVQFRNNVALQIAATIFDLVPDSDEHKAFMAAYTSNAVTLKGEEFIVDATPGDNKNIATLFQGSPDIKAAVMFAMADILANPSFYENTNGQLDEDKLKTLVTSYSLNTKSRMGIVTLETDDGSLVALRQEGYGWIPPFIKDPKKRKEQQATLVKNVLETPDAMTALRSPNTMQKMDVNLVDTAQSIIPDVDEQLFDLVASQLKGVRTNQNSVNTGTYPPAVDIVRLAAACSPSIQARYGGKPTDSMDRKLELAKIVIADLDDASKWGMEIDLTGNNSAYINSENGGIPISFKTLPSKTLINKDGTQSNLLKEVIVSTSFINDRFTPKNRVTNQPALSLPSYPQGSPEALAFGQDLKDSGIATTVAEVNSDETKPIRSSVLSYADTAPYKTPQDNSVYINNASAVSNKQMISIFGESGSVPIGSLTEFTTWFKLNVDTFVTASKSIPELKETTDILKTELSTGGTRNLFTNRNIPLMYEAAIAKGAKTNTDVAAYMFGIVKAKVLNIKPITDWNDVAAKEAEEELGISIPKGTFSIPSGRKAGKVLVNPSSPTYFDQIKAAGVLGYSVFQEARTEDIYISKDVIPKDVYDAPMTLLLGGKQSSEDDNSYTQRFTNAFTYQQTKRDLAGKAKAVVEQLIDNTYFNVSNPRTDTTILPSKYEAEYTAKYKEFREALNLDGIDVDPKDAYLAASIDWKHFWLDNGYLPNTLEYADPNITDINRIPDKYRLPLTPTTYSGSESTKVLRESYGSPIAQQQVNVALEILTKDDVDATVVYKDYDAASVKRIRQFTKDGWNPVAFEFQMRLVGSATNETDPSKIIPQMALESFPLTGQDVIRHMSLTNNEVKALQPKNQTGVFQELPEVIAFNSAFKKELQEVATDLKKDPKYPYIGPSLDYIITTTMNDKFYGVQFKIAYFEKWVLPTGRSADKTAIENRKQLTKDYLLRLLNK
jgi:hypothetical protein